MIKEIFRYFRIGTTLGTLRLSSDEIKRNRARKFLMELLGSSRGLSTKMGQFISLGNGDSDLEKVFKDSVNPMTREEVEEVLNGYYGGDYRSVFKKIFWDPRPASLGQVHQGILKSGGRVALKVRYPGIENSLENELRLLGWLPDMGPVKKWGMDFGSYVNEVRTHLKEELDYGLEAERQQRYLECSHAVQGIVVPRVYPEHCREGVLVQSYEEGNSLSKAGSLPEERRGGLGKILLIHYLHMLFHEGLLHSDPNPENFAFRATRHDLQVVLYDFGSLFEISKKERLTLLRIILALRQREALDPVSCLAGLGFDVQKLNDLRDKLPALLSILFEPFITEGPIDLEQWNLNKRWDEIAGELKWWFRSAAPPRAIFLMRSLHGLATHLRMLGACLPWKWVLDDVVGDLYQEARDCPLEPVNIEGGKDSVSFRNLSQFLKVHVQKPNGNRVALTMPARVIDSIEEVIDPPVLAAIKNKGIDLADLKRQVQASGYRPQSLFEVRDVERDVRVWLE